MAPRGEQALWLQLDQFLVLLAQNAGNGADPTAPPPWPRHKPPCPWAPVMALWLLPCWSMKIGAPPRDATASTSSRQPCLWEDRAQPGVPATSSCYLLLPPLFLQPQHPSPPEAMCLAGTNRFQHNRARGEPGACKSPCPVPDSDPGVLPAPAGACSALTGGITRPAPPVAATRPWRTRHG